MNCFSQSAWKLMLASQSFIATLAVASRAIADDINPDADIPDSSTIADSTPANPVLEIPQQCDQDSVAVLCDQSSSDGSSSADADATSSPEGGANVAINPSNDLPANAEVRFAHDYANQNITNECPARGTMNVPVGFNVPGGYCVPPVSGVAPAPAYVAPGPGGYQQWASGPGTYQQWARGPGHLIDRWCLDRATSRRCRWDIIRFGGFGGMLRMR